MPEVRGITRFDARNLEELWAELGKPNRVANLELKVTDPGPNGVAEEMRYSSVSFEPLRAWVHVKGPDETWVLGRAQQIKRRLRRTRRKLAGDPAAVYLVASVVGGAGVLVVYFLWLSGIVHGWLVWVLLLLADLAISVIIWRWWRRRNTTEIVLEDSRRPWSRDNRINLVATAVAVLSLALAAYQTWGPKH